MMTWSMLCWLLQHKHNPASLREHEEPAAGLLTTLVPLPTCKSKLQVMAVPTELLQMLQKPSLFLWVFFSCHMADSWIVGAAGRRYPAALFIKVQMKD